MNSIMENKKLEEQLRNMKSLMTEQETEENVLSDIKDLLVQKVSSKIKGSKVGDFIDDVVGGDFDVKNIGSYFKKTKKPGGMSNSEKMEIYSKVKTDDDFYEAVLWGLGLPVNNQNINFLKLWRIAEMGTEFNKKNPRTAINNPLNTTRPCQQDPSDSNFNSVGVKNYSKPEYGVNATVQTLKLPYYQCIVDGLRENQSYNEIAACTRRDGKKSAMDTWGTGSKHMLAVIEKFSKNPNVARKIDMEMD
jgi:hypothetical protein